MSKHFIVGAGIAIIPMLAWFLIDSPVRLTNTLASNTVAPSPAPSYVRYYHYPAGGRILLVPAGTDSTTAFLIPPGSVLLIPIHISGEDPERQKGKS